jgi:hypothetical protein
MREPPELDFEPEEPSVMARMMRLHLDTFGFSVPELAKLLHLHEHQVPQYYDLKEDRERAAPGLRLRLVQ